MILLFLLMQHLRLQDKFCFRNQGYQLFMICFSTARKRIKTRKKISSLKAKCAGKFNLFITEAKYFQKDKKDRQTVLINKTDK